jgi:hypothetical protein
MRQCIVTAHINRLTNVPIGFHIINKPIVMKTQDIYMKDLTITPMHFHETNGQVNQTKKI